MRPSRLRISFPHFPVVPVLPAISRFVAVAARAGLCAIVLAILSASASRAQNVTVGGIISTVAGTGTAGSTGIPGPANLAQLQFPSEVALDASGNLFISDVARNQILVVNKQTVAITIVGVTIQPGFVAVVAGTGATGYTGDGGLAVNATFNGANAALLDTAGNIYISDANNNAIRVVNTQSTAISIAGVTIQPNDVATVAGNGMGGFTGDAGPATSAELSSPSGIRVDAAGNIYIADYLNNRIRVVNAQSSTITIAGVTILSHDINTVAGSGSGSYSGDGGAAVSAGINAPADVAVDASGNIYIADQDNNRIRVVNAQSSTVTIAGVAIPSHDIQTVAGNGTLGYSGDHGAATSAELNTPTGIFVEINGDMLIGDDENSVIRLVNTSGTITTFAGDHTAGYSGDGGLAVNAELHGAFDVAADSFGDVYIADAFNAAVREVSSGTTLFGSVQVGQSASQTIAVNFNANGTLEEIVATGAGGDFQAANGTCLPSHAYVAGGTCTFSVTFTPSSPGPRWGPVFVDYDVSGAANYYFGLQGTGVAPAAAFTPGVITTVAGSNVSGFTGDNGPATSAEISTPWDVALDSAGTLFVVDHENERIRAVFLSDDEHTVNGITEFGNDGIATVAGNGTTGNTGDGAAATSAQLHDPQGVAVDSVGNLYIALAGSNNVRMVDNNGIITTVAGGGANCGTATDSLGDGCPATSATLSVPNGVAFDAAGNLYIADTFDNAIRRVSPAGFISTVAGGGTPCTAATDAFGDGCPATSATLNLPDGVAVDPSGQIYIADTGNNVVRKVDTNGIITIFAGNASAGFSGDGNVATAAELNSPYRVALDAAGDVYIDDLLNQRIRVVDTLGLIFTLVGNGTPGYSGDAGSALSAEISSPHAAVVDGAGNLYIADGANFVVREVNIYTPPAEAFGNEAVNGTSAAQTAGISNVGNAALNFTSLTWPTGFAKSTFGNDCAVGTPIALGLTCNVSTVFAPLSSGNFNNDVVIADNAFTGSSVIVVTGSATVAVSAAPTTLTFTSQPVALMSASQTVTLDNATGATITGIAITFTGTNGAEFTETDNCGTSLAATTSCTINVAFTPAAIGSGTHSAQLNIADSDASSPQTVTLSGTVVQGTPVITWATPTSITYGTALSATQLDATANVAGSFVYSPLSGAVLTAGAQTLHVTFTPTDTTDYTSPAAQVTLTVSQATPVITWAAPSAITYPAALSGTQLDATASVGGAFVYSPLSGAVLTAGAQPLHVTFTPTDATDYTTATGQVTLTVNQATPVITWATPAAITYPAPLTGTQLNATASVGGTFVYSPLAASVPTAGNDTLNVSFTPTDAVDYTTATANVTLVVHQATPTITWATPAAITFGTALSATQLDATASTAGTFVYAPAAGTVPLAGTPTLNVTFTPTDTVDFTTATANVVLTVNKATPVVTWATPAAITYGTTLSGMQLDATASTAGTFVYAPLSGTGLTAGNQTLNVTFTPTDGADYTTATGSVILVVNQATPVITWATPAAITYGATLSATQLNATASVAGTFVYSPLAGTTPTAGNDTLNVTFTPTDAVDYTTATGSVILVVHQATPVVTWTTPAAITYLTPLSATQLDATASVAGTFAYAPAASAVLGAGAQTLNVTFTPTDAVDYATATGSVTLTVSQATPVITWAAPAPIAYLTQLSATQLDATASTAGTFVYAPALGATLTVGNQTLNVTFTPTDAVDFTAGTASVVLSVTKATPVITWLAPAAITYGTVLSVTQLDATASTAGTFVYAPLAGVTLDAGAQTLSVTFTPTDAADFTTATANVALTVNKATSVITWAAPAAITFGTALSATQLNATASVAGAFVYSPLVGTMLGGGAQTLTVAFTPSDAVDYTIASANVTLTVNPIATVTALVSSGTPSNLGANVTFMATLTSAAGVPTGSVTFINGTTPLATVALTAGSATLITAALPLGTDNITANFTGSANFAVSASPIVAQVVVPPDFTVTPTSLSSLPPVPAGQAISVPLTLGASVVAGGTVVFSAAALPPNSSAIFAPPSLTLSTLAQNTVITIQTTPQFRYSSRQIPPIGRWPNPRTLEFAAIGFVLAIFGLFAAKKQKRRGWVLAFGGMALAAMLGGCANVGSSGGSATNFTNFGTPAGTYTVVVTGSDGTYQHSSTIVVVVD